MLAAGKGKGGKKEKEKNTPSPPKKTKKWKKPDQGCGWGWSYPIWIWPEYMVSSTMMVNPVSSPAFWMAKVISVLPFCSSSRLTSFISGNCGREESAMAGLSHGSGSVLPRSFPPRAAVLANIHHPSRGSASPGGKAKRRQTPAATDSVCIDREGKANIPLRSLCLPSLQALPLARPKNPGKVPTAHPAAPWAHHLPCQPAQCTETSLQPERRSSWQRSGCQPRCRRPSPRSSSRRR